MKHLVKIILISFSVLIFSGAQAQAQNLSTTIKVQAMDMATALMNNDLDAFIKYMHPDIIAFAGGKEQLKTKMDSAYVAMKQFGVSFKRYWIGNPGEIIDYKGQLQSVLPQTTTLKTLLGEMVVETSMIAISKDKGKNWWFIDTNVYRVDKLKNVLPDLSPRLVIPPPKQPKFSPEQSGN